MTKCHIRQGSGRSKWPVAQGHRVRRGSGTSAVPVLARGRRHRPEDPIGHVSGPGVGPRPTKSAGGPDRADLAAPSPPRCWPAANESPWSSPPGPGSAAFAPDSLACGQHVAPPPPTTRRRRSPTAAGPATTTRRARPPPPVAPGHHHPPRPATTTRRARHHPLHLCTHGAGRRSNPPNWQLSERWFNRS
jgi:hypothetical protein